ncbi:MAG: hypothetical protein R3F49_04810 [Planctomycetota bacterium]
MRHHAIARACVAAIALAPLAAGQSTRLTFAESGSPLSTSDLLHGYGDRVTGPASGGYHYEGSAGFTPNVLVSIGGQEGSALLEPQTWHGGYSDLLDVVYINALGAPQLHSELQVTLVADAGYEVMLRGFDVGSFGEAATLPYVRVTDEAGVVLEEAQSVVVPRAADPARHVALSASSRVLTLRVSLAGVPQPDLIGFDNLEFSQGPAGAIEVGSAYCRPAAANTSGGPGAVRAWGSAVVASNDVRLVATGLPFGSVGYFMTSRTAGFVARPAGSDGNLCLGASIGRFIGPGQVRLAGTAGLFSLRLDLTRLPTPTGLVAAQAGQAWHFQAWYRDSVNGVATSNFTDALAVTWQ